MRYGSLFAGIGGFDLVLDRAGMECAWQVEIDDACCQVLARHWPGAGRYRDVRDVTGGGVAAIDVLVGGFPCQDVSVAGRRAGLAGERSGLWFEFHRLAAQLRPRWLVIENVPGLLNSWSPTETPPSGLRAGDRWEVDESDDFETIVAALVELGYGLAWRVLDAQYFGVAQRRRRVFVVGCLGDPARAAQILLEPESCGGHPAPSRRPPEDAAGSIGSQPPGGGWRDDTDRMSFVVDMQNAAATDSVGTLQGEGMARQNRGYAVANPLPSYSGGGTRYEPTSDTPLVYRKAQKAHRPADGGRWEEAEAAATLDAEGNNTRTAHLVAHSLRASGADGSEDGTGHGTPLVAVAEPLDASYAKTADSAGSNGAGPRNVVLSFQERGRQGGRSLETQEDVAYSLNSPGDGDRAHERNVMQAMAVRRLTPVECERLQGFPDGWTEGLSDSARYRCLGNAVCVPVVEWIGRRIAGSLR